MLNRRSTWLLTASLAFVLAGCAPDTEEAADEDAAMEDAGAEMADAEEMGMDVTVALMPRGEGGVEGEAIAHHGQDSVTITLALEDVEAGRSYPAHIHTGTCDAGGAPAITLNPVEATAEGDATSVTTVAMAELPQSGEMFIMAHSPQGTPIACGDLPSHEDQMMMDEGMGEGMSDEGMGEGMSDEGMGEGMSDEGMGEGMSDEGMEGEGTR